MKRGFFKQKTYEEVLAIKLAKKVAPKVKIARPRGKLRLAGKSTTSELKREIQAILRQIVILRDGGCFLRNYTSRITPQYASCGGYRNDGELILQAEHLHTRSSAASFSDSRLVVCCCQRHHIYYKPQHSAEYNELAREYIGKENAKLWDRIKEDRTAHKVDLKLELLALQKQLKDLQNGRQRLI